MVHNIYSFIGLAVKAGKLISGEEACERAIKQKNISLIIIAEDASLNTKKKFTDKCKYRDVDMRFFGTKEMIGRYIGKEIRSVIAISDAGFAKKLIEKIDGCSNEIGGEHIG
ncbi:MAG: ribosomal L7Ae/L30e/S12e/Gadd45 family protein [Bacillota bacterium]|nr:ribosomal L7Ae/L30e/S12e/Gadd45 family protein [Bacillota bacterium]